MKTLCFVLASLTIACFALGLGFRSGFLFQPVAKATLRAVPLTVRSVETPSRSLGLSAQEREHIAGALSQSGERIAKAQLYAERFETNPYITGTDGAMASFSLELILNDGARLISRPRKVPRAKLAVAVDECLDQCLEAYDQQRKQGRTVRTLSNL